jgi:hypothetical protein
MNGVQLLRPISVPFNKSSKIKLFIALQNIYFIQVSKIFLDNPIEGGFNKSGNDDQVRSAVNLNCKCAVVWLLYNMQAGS